MSGTNPETIASLPDRGLVHSSLSAVLGPDTTAGAEWKEFAGSWGNLHRDTYMADGGTYRLRRYSEFLVDTANEGLTLLPHVPYSQSRNINYLNGGIDRHFEPFEKQVAGGALLSDILHWCADALKAVTGNRRWKVQSFQNRILARDAEAGQPTPEGLHRDGVDYVLTLLIDRESIDGGVSAVYAADTRELLAEVLLTEPGEFLFADDVRMLHSVTPLIPIGSAQGHRDVLIAMFTRADG
ncbi:2OG-Fe dioxygenase family protein [Streptomyces sp. NPDC004561]